MDRGGADAGARLGCRDIDERRVRERGISQRGRGDEQLDRQLQRDFNAANDRGPQAQASFIPCGPFVAVCVRVAIGVGTKIAGRGSSAVKSVAREPPGGSR